MTKALPIAAPSRQVLKRVPERAVAFLVAVGTRPELRALLARGGYCAQAHAEGARLLARVYAYGEAVPCDSDPNAAVREAFAAIEQWVRANFNRYRLALERLQPGAPNPFGGFDGRKRGDAVFAAVTPAVTDRVDWSSRRRRTRPTLRA